MAIGSINTVPRFGKPNSTNGLASANSLPPPFTRNKDTSKVAEAPSTQRPAHPAAPNKDHITLHGTNVHPGIYAMRNETRFKEKKFVLISAAVDRLLKKEGIPHRFGGSVAAALHGGKRKPGDVDVEVGNEPDAQKALALLSNLDETFKMGAGEVHMTGKLVLTHGNMGGQVRITTTYPNGKVVETDVDVLNENDPNMSGGLHSPHSRRVGLDPRGPSYLTSHDLIANYLDRLVNKPEYARSKEDPEQIMNILRNDGFDPKNPSQVDSLLQEITARAKPGYERLYGVEMRQIIDAMISAEPKPVSRLQVDGS